MCHDTSSDGSVWDRNDSDCVYRLPNNDLAYCSERDHGTARPQLLENESVTVAGGRRSENTIAALKGMETTDSMEKANSFNFYYSTVFSSEGNIPHIQGENSSEPFT
jgi:hypothetical protein